MTDQLTTMFAALCAVTSGGDRRASARRPRRRGEAGIEVIVVVILCAAFAAIAIALSAVIRSYVLDSASKIPKQGG